MKEYFNRKRKYGVFAVGTIILTVLLFWYKGEALDAGIWLKSSPFTVAIDPGHGGFDPGKVGVDGTLEKDINLSISLILKDLLEKENIKVIITRTEDKAVGQGDGEAKKQEDMKARVMMINESKADIAVSIHQNSFTDESSKGAQVFYHTESEEGAALAKVIQEQIKLSAADDNHRMEKANNDYYLLKKTTCPIVIVECGFLSNYAEAALLNEKAYQRKIAEGVAKGILLYLDNKEDTGKAAIFAKKTYK